MPIDLYPLAGPVLRHISPEFSHHMAILALRWGLGGLVGGSSRPDDPVLGISLWGKQFPNPVGLAAGFDKNAEAINPLLKLGFGFIEVGGVTPRPQPGNPRPRVFRLPEDRAMVNRMGFNNDGLEVVSERLKGRNTSLPGLLAVNLGKNKTTEAENAASDYEKGARAFAPLADFLVINVSSPNTPGLRALQGREPLIEIVQRTQAAIRESSAHPPLLLKIAPDLTEADEVDIADVALSEGLDGLIISNTTIARPDSLKGAARAETGGLSGAPLFAPSTALLGRMYQRTNKTMPLVGVGGITTGADAYAKIRAGASLIQFYTAMIYQGPAMVYRIKQDLTARLKADGFSTLIEAVGADHQ